MRPVKGIVFNPFGDWKNEGEIFWQAHDGATTAGAERGAQLTLVGAVGMASHDDEVRTARLLIVTLFIITAGITCHEKNVNSHQYLGNSFHSPNLRSNGVQSGCKDDNSLKI